jgi:pimeloyl-ACP methyl ester carboxylesterase
VIFSADDADLSPDLARRLARLFADAELQLIDDAGRWPPRNQAEVVAQTITTAVAHPVS